LLKKIAIHNPGGKVHFFGRFRKIGAMTLSDFWMTLRKISEENQGGVAALDDAEKNQGGEAALDDAEENQSGEAALDDA